MSGASVYVDSGAPVRVRRFGPWQAIWAVVGLELLIFAIDFAGSFGRDFAIGFLHGLHHTHGTVPPSSPLFRATLTLTADAVAAAWCFRYVKRRAGVRLQDGGSTGLALRSAPARAYVTGAAVSLALCLFLAVLFSVWPPSHNLHGPSVYALGIEAKPGGVVIALALVNLLALAPVVEEFLFRGALFAGLVEPLGRVLAGASTVALFTVLHVPDKLGYLPGLAAVALLGTATLLLRLQYRSLGPPMLCHAFYNFGTLVVTGICTRGL